MQNSSIEKLLSKSNQIKMLLMILIVFYHSLALWHPDGWFIMKPNKENMILSAVSLWLNSFHVYAFTILAGFIFAYNKYIKGKYTDYKKFILGKFRRLIIPYIVVSILYVIPIATVYYKFSFKQIFIYYGLGANPSQLWFLLMLFPMFMIAFLVSDQIFKKPVLGLGLSVILYIFGSIGNEYIPNVFQILTACRFFSFFWIGMIMVKYDNCVQFLLNKLSLICGSVLEVGIVIILWVLEMNNLLSSVGGKLIYFFICLFGGLWAIALLYTLCEKRTPGYFERYLMKYNFVIYLFHQQIIWCCIWYLNTKLSSIVLIMINFIISLSISLIMGLLLNRNRITRKVVVLD